MGPPEKNCALAAAPSPTRYMYGIRSEVPPPCNVTNPEYTPGLGTTPDKVTVRVADAPGIKVGGAVAVKVVPATGLVWSTFAVSVRGSHHVHPG